MNKNELKRFLLEESRPKAYRYQALISPLRNVFQDTEAPVHFDKHFLSNYGGPPDLLRNMSERYLRDFFGIQEDSENLRRIPCFDEDGHFQKNIEIFDICQPIDRENVTTIKAKKIPNAKFSTFANRLDKNEIKNSFFPRSDGPFFNSEFRSLAAADFFAKNITQSAFEDGFVFVKSVSADSEPTLFNAGWENAGLAAEHNILYAKIKYLEKDQQIYVENRRASIIKKRYLLNLTVRNQYFDNLIASLYCPAFFDNEYRAENFTMRPSYNSWSYNPASSSNNAGLSLHRIDKLRNETLISPTFRVGFDSVQFANDFPQILQDIRDYDEEDYVVIDTLDFTYNKTHSASKAFLIGTNGTTKITIPKCGAISVSSPSGVLSNYNLKEDNITISLSEACRMSTIDYQRAGASNNKHLTSSLKSIKKWGIREDHKLIFDHLFRLGRKQINRINSDSIEIESKSFWPVISRIKQLSLDESSKKRIQYPANASKLTETYLNDTAQILLDRVIEETPLIYSNFLKNGYKVTIRQIKQSFDLVPKLFKATKSDWEIGDAIHLGEEMYLKLIRCSPGVLRGCYLNGRFLPPPADITRLQRDGSLPDVIRSTLGWFVTFHYERTSQSVLNLRQSLDAVNSYLKYDESIEASNSPIVLNYENSKSIFQPRYDVLDGMSQSVKIDKIQPNINSSKLIRDTIMEPLFEPLQYKVVSKDIEGNILFSTIRPFLGVTLKKNGDSDQYQVSLAPFLPKESFCYFFPKERDNLFRYTAYQCFTHNNETGELGVVIDAKERPEAPTNMFDPCVTIRTSSVTFGSREKSIASTSHALRRTLYDIFHDNLSSRRGNQHFNSQESIGFNLSQGWSQFSYYQSSDRFFKDYKIPEIIFLEVGRSKRKSIPNTEVKGYFAGTAFELLRLDAWLGVRPADKRNLNLRDPKHWVNVRRLFDGEFWRYANAVILHGAYHLPHIVELGLDLKEIEYEKYQTPEFQDCEIHPSKRGFYAVAIFGTKSSKLLFEPKIALSYAAGCIDCASTGRGIALWATRPFLDYSSENIKQRIGSALQDLKTGKLSSFEDFLVQVNITGNVSESHKKSIKKQLRKFFLSEFYVSASMTSLAGSIIETILETGTYDVGTENIIANLDQEIISVISDNLCSTPLVNAYRGVADLPSVLDPEIKCTVSDVFAYYRVLINEQRFSTDTSFVQTEYRRFVRNLMELAKYSSIDLNNRKILFPDALKTQMDVVNYQVELLKNQIEESKFKEATKEYKKMEFKSGQYLIRMAKNPLELDLEGTRLGHCVGTYSSRMVQGSSVIFFLRNVAKPEEPMVTVEFAPNNRRNLSADPVEFKNNSIELIRRGTISQIQGMSRRKVNREEALFLNKWRMFVQDQMRKSYKVLASADQRNRIRVKFEFAFTPEIQRHIDDAALTST